MTPEPRPAEVQSLGLCLSGGGFRAAFYVLGALRYLAEAGRLAELKVISAVSGGSIAAAMLADRWDAFEAAGGDLDAFLSTIDKPFRDIVTTKNLRNEWLRRSLLHPTAGGRGAMLARTLKDHLYEHDLVSDLPATPQVIFTSTDLGTGRAFRIAQAFVGSYDHGYVQPAPASLRLGTAVAASAAFPPSLSVLSMTREELGLPAAVGKPPLSLVDGGVYDNGGLEWIQGWDPDGRRPANAIWPSFVIVANASGQLLDPPKKYGALGSVFRDQSIQYTQTVDVRVRWFVDQIKGGLGYRPLHGTYIGIRHGATAEGADPAFTTGALPSDLDGPLAELRTDLDRFETEEADLLSYHAYWSLHARLKTFAPALTVDEPAWQEFANMTGERKAELAALLQRGAKRTFSR